MRQRLRWDPTACTGHGLCADLLPERIELDDVTAVGHQGDRTRDCSFGDKALHALRDLREDGIGRGLARHGLPRRGLAKGWGQDSESGKQDWIDASHGLQAYRRLRRGRVLDVWGRSGWRPLRKSLVRVLVVCRRDFVTSSEGT